MPLPTGDMTWPPIPDPIMSKYREHRAWYDGDTLELQAIYGGAASRPKIAWAPDDVGQPAYRRMANRISRWFWGQPNPPHEERVRSHVPMPSTIASTSAAQLFSEELSLDFGDDTANPDTSRLDEILDGNNWQSFLLEAAEIQSVLGGVYWRIVWDTEVADYPLVTAMHADQAWPEFRFGRLMAVTFWQVVAVDGGTVWRHLERHERGQIQHGLYEGTAQHLGQPRPLTEQSDTAFLADLVNADAAIPTIPDLMTAGYVPNLRPNRKRGSIDLGRSDFDGVEHLFDELDETWSSMMRELRLGKARLLIPQNMLETHGAGEGASFDLDRELIVQLADIAGSAADEKLQTELIQPALRIADHLQMVDALKLEIVAGAGYSAQTFGLTTDTVITATEVAARERQTLVTREKKTRYWSTELADLIEALTAIDQTVFGGGPRLRPTVVFPIAVQPSLNDISTAVQNMNAAQAISTEQKVRMLHPDWDDEQIADEVALIKAETGLSVPDLSLPPNPDGQDAAALGMIPDAASE